MSEQQLVTVIGATGTNCSATSRGRSRQSS